MEIGMGMQRKWLMFVSVAVMSAGLMVVSSQASELGKHGMFICVLAGGTGDHYEMAVDSKDFCENLPRGWTLSKEKPTSSSQFTYECKFAKKVVKVANADTCRDLALHEVLASFAICKHKCKIYGKTMLVVSDAYCKRIAGARDGGAYTSNNKYCDELCYGLTKDGTGVHVVEGECMKIGGTLKKPLVKPTLVKCFKRKKGKYTGMFLKVTDKRCKYLGGTLKKPPVKPTFVRCYSIKKGPHKGKSATTTDKNCMRWGGTFTG